MSSSDEETVVDEGEQTTCGIFPVCVPTGSVGAVQNLGRYSGTLGPGLSFFCPCTHSIQIINLALQPLECTTECKTKDNVTLSVTTVVTYRINKMMVRQAVFEIDDPQSVMRAQIDNVVRSNLPAMDLDEAYSNKDTLCNDIVREVRINMMKYGYSIETVLITDLRPERSVLEAMNQINAAKRNREAATAEADAKKILQVKEAEADAEAKYLSGMGIARMRKAMADGVQESMQVMSQGGLSPQESMHLMVTTQYLDTLKEFANKDSASTIMVPCGPGAASDIEAQVKGGLAAAPGQAMMGGKGGR